MSIDFSKAAKNLLRDNNYTFKSSNDVFVIKRSNADKILIYSILVLVCIPITFVVFPMSQVFVFAMWFLVLGTAFIQLRSTPDSSVLKLDKATKVLTNGHERIVASDVKSVDFDSKFIASYTSAFKDSNEEHQIALVITMKNGQKHNIFHFKSDYAEPNQEILEVERFLKDEIAKRQLLLE